jgi:hypothetical protein
MSTVFPDAALLPDVELLEQPAAASAAIAAAATTGAILLPFKILILSLIRLCGDCCYGT